MRKIIENFRAYTAKSIKFKLTTTQGTHFGVLCIDLVDISHATTQHIHGHGIAEFIAPICGLITCLLHLWATVRCNSLIFSKIKECFIICQFLPMRPVITQPIFLVIRNMCVTVLGSIGVSVTFFCVAITAQSPLFMATEVMPSWLMLLKAFSA